MTDDTKALLAAIADAAHDLDGLESGALLKRAGEVIAELTKECSELVNERTELMRESQRRADKLAEANALIEKLNAALVRWIPDHDEWEQVGVDKDGDVILRESESQQLAEDRALLTMDLTPRP